MTRFELISNQLCPYTQRAAIQLAEKGLPYERTYIDLAAKPAWFEALSPLGKVPVLRVGEKALFETAVICEYIEDVVPAIPMWSPRPLDRARERAWSNTLAQARTSAAFASVLSMRPLHLYSGSLTPSMR